MTNYILLEGILPKVIQTLTIRPSSNNSVTLFNNGSSNWNCVSNISELYWVYATKADGGSYKTDLYNIDNHTTENGVISYIEIFIKVNGVSTNLSRAKTVIREGAVTTYGTEHIFSYGWRTFSESYNVKPSDSTAWTWADIDNLISGVSLFRDADGGATDARTKCCAVWVEVHFAGDLALDCSIIAPEEVSTDHAQNIKEMSMWNGERIVFGESRSKWSLLLKGQDWENDACDKILCMKQLGLSKNPVVISGLNNLSWDGEWMIKSIGWKLLLEKPLHYKWIILLEKT